MKNKVNYFALFLLFLTLSLTSCTETSLEESNDEILIDKDEITEQDT